jgi:hypothetical protein
MSPYSCLFHFTGVTYRRNTKPCRIVSLVVFRKAVPLQAWTGPWRSGRLRPRIFLTFGTRRW